MWKIPGKESTPKGIAPLRRPPGQLGDIDPAYGLWPMRVPGVVGWTAATNRCKQARTARAAVASRRRPKRHTTWSAEDGGCAQASIGQQPRVGHDN